MEKTKISARVIADSITRRDKRITSMVVTAPRIILAEFNTHRMFSRNSASSRAIPFETMVKRVKEDPFIPIAWMVDHKGMQGNEYFPDDVTGPIEAHWLEARDRAVHHATNLSTIGLTKQIVNRLLEPFLWHNIIVTATEWDNFMKLRLHPAAEIHIQEVAQQMLNVLNGSTPKVLQEGEWHIPFGDNMKDPIIFQMLKQYFGEDRFLEGTNNPVSQPEYAKAYWDIKLKIATARCARVSYLNYEGKDDYEADVKLYEQLASSGHWSPFEHCATPTPIGEQSFGNFKGWTQLRHIIQSGEFNPDDRLIKHSIGE
jgi:thymidylate synthase ThyX